MLAGTLAVAWDEDVDPGGQPYVPKTSPPNDEFLHVLWVGGVKQNLSMLGLEQIDISVTHWTGQYVPTDLWPRVCGPMPYSDPPVADAEGKDCNVFHGDYTGLAVGPDDMSSAPSELRYGLAPAYSQYA